MQICAWRARGQRTHSNRITDARRICGNQSHFDREHSEKNSTLLQSTANVQQLSVKQPTKTNNWCYDNKLEQTSTAAPRLPQVLNVPVEERSRLPLEWIHMQRVGTVLEMGYSENLVRNSLRHSLRGLQGDDFSSLTQLSTL